MKILSTPDYSDWKQELQCYFCSTKVEINIKDLKYKVTKTWYQDYHDGGGYYANVDTYYVGCPVCKKDINVHTGNIPRLIQENLKNAKT